MSIKDMWKYLIFQTKGYRIIEVVIVLGSLCGAVIAYVNSFLFAKIVNQLIVSNYTKAVHITITMILVIWILQMIFNACNQVFEQYIYPSRDETKKRTAAKAFTMEYEEFEKEETMSAFRKVRAGENGSGTIDDQLKTIYELFTECVKVFFAFGFLIILIMQASFGGVSIGRMILLSAILVIMFGFSFWVNFRVSEKVGKRQVEINVENERTNSLGIYVGNMLDSDRCAKDIRLYEMQDYLCRKYGESIAVSKAFTEYGIFLGKNNAKFSFVVQLLAGYIYVYVAIMALSGTVTTGDVLMYAGAIITMMTSVQTILMKYNQINYCNEYLKSYEEFIERPNMHYEGTLPIEKRDDNRYELSFHNVSFKYPGTDTYILKNISLKFTIGQKVAIVGRNGEGKTTLIKLLLRLYEPSEGEIQLNGINIGKYDYDEYLHIFSVVFQDFKLFDFPLDENIASGEELNSDHIRQVIEQVGLSDLVNDLPEKEHTVLYHENGAGVSLSGGEAQKVAIARAIYKEAPFVILDEPTAALDPLAEAEIYENFDSLVGDKTAIYISHRMSSCRFCDRIIVLNNGTIAEEGSHDSLLRQGGIYAELYNTQAEYYKTE